MNVTGLPPDASGLGSSPPAPGALGATVDTSKLLQYLDAQRVWNSALVAELRELDAAVAGDPASAGMLNDLTLAWSLSAAIDRHYERIVGAWDSGRVKAADTVKVVNLLWERLDGSLNSALAVSFVEACTLAEALVRRLDERLGSNGALLQHRMVIALGLADEVQVVAARCREKIQGAPKLAVPDPKVLGDVPVARSDRVTFEARLTNVEAALQAALVAFTHALDAREELRQLLGAYADMAAKRRVGESAEVAAAEAAARNALWSAPCDVDMSRTLVADYRRTISSVSGGGQ